MHQGKYIFIAMRDLNAKIASNNPDVEQVMVRRSLGTSNLKSGKWGNDNRLLRPQRPSKEPVIEDRIKPHKERHRVFSIPPYHRTEDRILGMGRDFSLMAEPHDEMG